MELPGTRVLVHFVPCRQRPGEAAPGRLPVLASPHASSLQDLSVPTEVSLSSGFDRSTSRGRRSPGTALQSSTKLHGMVQAISSVKGTCVATFSPHLSEGTLMGRKYIVQTQRSVPDVSNPSDKCWGQFPDCVARVGSDVSWETRWLARNHWKLGGKCHPRCCKQRLLHWVSWVWISFWSGDPTTPPGLCPLGSAWALTERTRSLPPFPWGFLCSPGVPVATAARQPGGIGGKGGSEGRTGGSECRASVGQSAKAMAAPGQHMGTGRVPGTLPRSNLDLKKQTSKNKQKNTTERNTTTIQNQQLTNKQVHTKESRLRSETHLRRTAERCSRSPRRWVLVPGGSGELGRPAQPKGAKSSPWVALPTRVCGTRRDERGRPAPLFGSRICPRLALRSSGGEIGAAAAPPQLRGTGAAFVFSAGKREANVGGCRRGHLFVASDKGQINAVARIYQVIFVTGCFSLCVRFVFPEPKQFLMYCTLPA